MWVWMDLSPSSGHIEHVQAILNVTDKDNVYMFTKDNFKDTKFIFY